LLITAELSNVTAPETFPVPSKPVVNVASPVPEIVLPAAKAVAVEAFPVKAPTKDVEVIDTIPAIVLTVERAAIAVVPNVNNVPVNALVATLPVVICNNLESAIEPASIVFVTVPVSPEVINIPEVAGIVSVVAPATDGTNVTVPEVDPGKQSIKFQLKLG
jgi:hypothetical protein